MLSLLIHFLHARARVRKGELGSKVLTSVRQAPWQTMSFPIPRIERNIYAPVERFQGLVEGDELASLENEFLEYQLPEDSELRETSIVLADGAFVNRSWTRFGVKFLI